MGDSHLALVLGQEEGPSVSAPRGDARGPWLVEPQAVSEGTLRHLRLADGERRDEQHPRIELVRRSSSSRSHQRVLDASRAPRERGRDAKARDDPLLDGADPRESRSRCPSRWIRPRRTPRPPQQLVRHETPVPEQHAPLALRQGRGADDRHAQRADRLRRVAEAPRNRPSPRLPPPRCGPGAAQVWRIARGGHEGVERGRRVRAGPAETANAAPGPGVAVPAPPGPLPHPCGGRGPEQDLRSNDLGASSRLHQPLRTRLRVRRGVQPRGEPRRPEHVPREPRLPAREATGRPRLRSDDDADPWRAFER